MARPAKSLLIILGACLALGTLGVAARYHSAQLEAQQVSHSYVPEDGFVPNAETAAAIAEAVLIPIYDHQQIRRQKPFVVVLHDEVWAVTGQLPRGHLGGVARVERSRQDGRILRVTHGR